MAAPLPSAQLGAFVCQSCRHLTPKMNTLRRSFTTAMPLRDLTSQPRDAFTFASPVRRQLGGGSRHNRNGEETFSSILDSSDDPQSISLESKPHRLHVLAHKHNTHITFVQPQKLATETASSSISTTSTKAEDKKKKIDVLLSLSTGNIGFKKAGRGSFDAAFQLAAYTLKTIQEKGMLADVRNLEVVLRGFGPGREAVTKALLGTEGRLIRPHIKSVVDATRLKFGGTRSKRPRRLG